MKRKLFVCMAMLAAAMLMSAPTVRPTILPEMEQERETAAEVLRVEAEAKAARREEKQKKEATRRAFEEQQLSFFGT